MEGKGPKNLVTLPVTLHDVVNHWPSGWTNGYYRELFATLGISYLPSLKIQEGIFSKPNLKIEGIKATDVKDVFTLGKYS